MGEVFKPENLGHKREKPISDLPSIIQPIDYKALLREIELLKAEVVKIKRILREKGILVD